jgi:16S rRNA (cytosine1402-N4)-methyltransferase
MTYHQAVLLKPSTEGLNINPSGIYVDVTFGAGGHSREILSHLNNQGKLFGFDQDADALRNNIEDSRFTLVPHNFRYLKNFLKLYKSIPVDGILADLGVSSHQFDTAERGFSIRFDGPLDMRMNQNDELSAQTVVNEYEEEDLYRIFKQYGEIKNTGKLCRTIIASREKKQITTTGQLNELCQTCAPRYQENKYLARVFQALRIEVNHELDALQEFLLACGPLIKAGGRLSVITYHSLEDRLVKNYMRSGHFDGHQEKDFYGNLLAPFKPINRKPIIADEAEITSNPRSRSAKLRVAERGQL